MTKETKNEPKVTFFSPPGDLPLIMMLNALRMEIRAASMEYAGRQKNAVGLVDQTQLHKAAEQRGTASAEAEEALRREQAR